MNAEERDELDAGDMTRLAWGNGTALNDLMDRHGEKLFHYLVRALQDEEDAGDLAQETFVRVYQNREKFDGRQSFSTWLYAIASNLVRDRYRWRRRHPQVSLEGEESDGETGLKARLVSEGAGPEERAEADERADAVRRAIGTLPEDLRQALILSVYEELPQAEIATILKCSVKAVETRLYRARQQLRETLGELARER
jgi:RNA polymerase sigma-70 factor (ECF subfamily)